MNAIYALREAGSDENRYIGRTAKPLPERLHKHLLNARVGYPPRISEWLASTTGVVIVPLAYCDDADAIAEERRLVEHYHARGHRLTNAHLLPRSAVSA